MIKETLELITCLIVVGSFMAMSVVIFFEDHPACGPEYREHGD